VGRRSWREAGVRSLSGPGARNPVPTTGCCAGRPMNCVAWPWLANGSKVRFGLEARRSVDAVLVSAGVDHKAPLTGIAAGQGLDRVG